MMAALTVLEHLWIFSFDVAVIGIYTRRLARDILPAGVTGTAVRVHQELVWPVMVIQFVQIGNDARHGHPASPWDAFTLGAAFAVRNWPDDDTPWRRRRRKLAGTVKALGGKLIMVPHAAR